MRVRSIFRKFYSGFTVYNLRVPQRLDATSLDAYVARKYALLAEINLRHRNIKVRTSNFLKAYFLLCAYKTLKQTRITHPNIYIYSYAFYVQLDRVFIFERDG